MLTVSVMGTRRFLMVAALLMVSGCAAVVPDSINVDLKRGGGRADLEVDGAAFVDADICREPLKRRIACAIDVPLARRIARQVVLAHNRIRSACLRLRFGTGAQADANRAEQ